MTKYAGLKSSNRPFYFVEDLLNTVFQFSRFFLLAFQVTFGRLMFFENARERYFISHVYETQLPFRKPDLTRFFFLVRKNSGSIDLILPQGGRI